MLLKNLKRASVKNIPNSLILWEIVWHYFLELKILIVREQHLGILNSYRYTSIRTVIAALFLIAQSWGEKTNIH